VKDPGRSTILHFVSNSLAALRGVHGELASAPGLSVASVSHGTTWSLYFHDPEGNCLEVFADTPWHVDQPVRFEIDFALPDDELTQATEIAIRDRSGFRPRDGSAPARKG
jgi:catechol 2,3-dioxygenase